MRKLDRNFCWPSPILIIVRIVLALGIYHEAHVQAQLRPQPADDNSHAEIKTFPTGTVFTNSQAVDQDDLCIFPAIRSDEARIIVSDKAANQIFCYSVDGKLHDSVKVPYPGNIDIRGNVPWGEKPVDILVTNLRETQSLAVFQINASPFELQRIDKQITTQENYGGALYRSQRTSRIYFFCTSKTSGVFQYELTWHEGKVGAHQVRHFPLGMCEGAVADDQNGHLYVCEESVGVWKFPAEPDDQTPRVLLIPVGQNWIRGDVEGITLWRSPSESWLVFSDQATSTFHAFDIEANQYIGAFRIEGAVRTDGVDIGFVVKGDLDACYLICHTDQQDGKTVITSNWAPIRDHLRSMQTK